MERSEFKVIGISVRTTNENAQSSRDIPQLWSRFFAEGILEKIPNKIDSSLYCIYTDYEGDFTKPYTTILGCRVESLKNIPNGLIGITIPEGNYAKFIAKGDLTKGVVFSEWTKIWQSELNRKYSADFEIYGERAQNPQDAEVDIFIALK